MASVDRQKRIDLALAATSVKCGKSAVDLCGSRKAEKIEIISTQCLPLDIALGVGGWPRGRIIELFGPESSGKSTLLLHSVAETQRVGMVAALVETEHAFDARYAADLNVDVNNLLISQPDCIEDALDVIEALASSGGVDLVAFDSVAATPSKAEINGEYGDANMGVQGRLYGQAMRRLSSIASQNNVCIIFVNQVRDNLGYGAKEVTPGGRAIKFHSSVRARISQTDIIKQGTLPIGIRSTVRIVKNKVAAPYRECEIEIYFGQGISRELSTLKLAASLSVIRKSGSWYYPDINDQESFKLQGEVKTAAWLKENQDAFILLDTKTREATATIAPFKGLVSDNNQEESGDEDE